jgi:P27 family predicted phage terminase small subunit
VKGRKPSNIEKADKPYVCGRAPSWFSKEAKAEWSRCVPLLNERKILTAADLGSLEAYCVASGLVRQMEAVIHREGHVTETARGGLRAHPAVQIQSDATTRARLLAGELGLNPISRSRASIQSSDDDENDQPFLD